MTHSHAHFLLAAGPRSLCQLCSLLPHSPAAVRLLPLACHTDGPVPMGTSTLTPVPRPVHCPTSIYITRTMLGTKLPCKGLDSISREVLRGQRRGMERPLLPPALWAGDEAKVAPLYIVLEGLEPGGWGWQCWHKTADLSSGG